MMGDHYLINLYGCNARYLDDENYVRETLEFSAIVKGKMTLLNLIFHKFEPHGISAIALLAESHISIHTWPETRTAACDVYTCGDSADPEAVVEYLKERFKASNESTVQHVKR